MKDPTQPTPGSSSRSDGLREPLVSVLIATRDRPASLERCLTSVLENDEPRFEVIVIDQSSDRATERARVLDDVRVRALRSAPGKARALNVGVAAARGSILALTDDDCVVPPNWLALALEALQRSPGCAVLFGAVDAAPHDPAIEFIPVFRPAQRLALASAKSAPAPGLGMGANMIIQRDVVLSVGGFDEQIGPGSRFRSGDDWDFAYRALRAGHLIVQDPSIRVTHFGARSFAGRQAARLLRNNYYGLGAALIKHCRCGDRRAVWLLTKVVARLVAGTVSGAVRLRRGVGLGSLLGLATGAAAGLTAPVDRTICRFRSRVASPH